MATAKSSRRTAEQSTSDESQEDTTTTNQHPVELAPKQPNLFGEAEARRFDGDTVSPRDIPRLTGQLQRVASFLADGKARTLPAIAKAAQSSETSASARVRDLRKPRNGGHTVLCERDETQPGVWRYRLVLGSGGCDE